MTSNWSCGRIAHLLLWCSLVVALLTVSIPKIYSGATEYPLRPGGALHTTDSYLKFATGAEGASKNLIVTPAFTAFWYNRRRLSTSTK